MATTSDTFQVILAEFKKSLPPKELENFQVTTLADVRESIIRIQRDQEELKRMMNMTRLESFLEAMEQFGKVIEVFVNASNFVAFVWGPMKLILLVRH
jgi:molecular chaperone GrpE (heat shock protein)